MTRSVCGCGLEIELHAHENVCLGDVQMVQRKTRAVCGVCVVFSRAMPEPPAYYPSQRTLRSNADGFLSRQREGHGYTQL